MGNFYETKNDKQCNSNDIDFDAYYELDARHGSCIRKYRNLEW